MAGSAGSEGEEAAADTGRLEAFSDGVFAIAVTLLILDVRPEGGGSLADQLGRAWPRYASFVISFVVVGVMWLNHHAMFRSIRRADHALVLANLLLLLCVTVIPFPTRLAGDTLAAGSAADQRIAGLLYGATFVASGLCFPLLWAVAARGGGRLLDPRWTAPRIRARLVVNLLGAPFLIGGTLICLWSPRGSLAFFGVTTLIYLLPGEALERRLLSAGRRGR